MSMRVRVDTRGLQKKLARIEKVSRGAFKNSINRTVTYGRRMIAEELVTRTGLKRKRIFDAINIGRASDANLAGNITPLFPGANGAKPVTRIWLHEFKFRAVKTAKNQTQLIGAGPRYVRALRTGFFAQFSFDSQPSIYMREGKKLRRARAAQVPTMFEQYDIVDRWGPRLADRVAAEAREEIAAKTKEGL